MSLLLSLRKRLILPVLLAAFPSLVWSQIAAAPQANEYPVSGPLAGDQVHSSLSLNQNGGYLVWEENGSARTGSEIKAIRLNGSLTKIANFTINKVSKGDQVNPEVQLLANGDAIFVWQSYGLGNADIYARILKDNGSFASADLRVNSDSRLKTSYAKDQQSAPAVCALQSGDAFVVWQSLGQDGNLMGIYGKIVPAVGRMATNEILINQTTRFNQRSPSVTTLANGNVVVTWVSEMQRFTPPIFSGGVTASGGSMDIYARIFSPNGTALTGELLINSGNNVCASPSVAGLPNGDFTVVWAEKDLLSRSNSWDIVGRSFSSAGVANAGDAKINTTVYGDQYRPKVTAIGNDCAVVWASLGQDGSREGVFGRLLQAGNLPSGDEFQVNNTTVSQQIHPATASSGSDRFLVSWSSYVRGTSFDLFARAFTLNQQP